MRLYRVRVRRYFPHFPTTKRKAKKDQHWVDASVVIEAEDLEHAEREGFDTILGARFFGADPKLCEVMETATVTLPYYL